MSLSDRVEAILQRPFKVLFQEPILIALTVYMSARDMTSMFVSLLTPFSSSSTAVFICCSKRIR